MVVHVVAVQHPRRILHLATGNLYGGVEVFLHTLARHPGVAGMSPEFTVCWAEGRLGTELRATRVPVQDLGPVRLTRPWQVWRARHRLQARLRTHAPDVVVVHSAWTQAVLGPVVRRAGHPLVMGVHTCVPRDSRLERWARRCPLDGVFANSAFTAASARDWYPGHPEPTVILLPVEAPAPPSDLARPTLRQHLGAGPDACVILQASRMQSLKGQRTLVSALASMASLPGWQCWLAGGAQRPEELAFERELRSLVAGHGLADRVTFLGQRNDLPALVSAADIVCQVNEEPEAFGLVYVEAMAAGRPVIAADRGGVTEVLDATCGALVPPGAVDALAGVLRRWVIDPTLRARLGEGGRARAAERCSVDRQLAVLGSFLDGVCEAATKTGGGLAPAR